MLGAANVNCLQPYVQEHRRSTRTFCVLHVSCVTEMGHMTRYCRPVWHRRIEKRVPELTVASWVRKTCQTLFDDEASLHLWKRHPWLWTVWRKLTDWREQVATWRDKLGPLYSHGDAVCLLIQLNCFAFQTKIYILTVIAWLFGHYIDT
jgi:hypothetical protein